MSGGWHVVIEATDFPDDGKLATKINGWHVLIGREDGNFFAVNDRCTHQAALLSGGRIRRGAIMCPLHGARFELESGKCLGGAYRDLRTFPLRIISGQLEICLPGSAPGMEDLPVVL
jgi:nitrite reductase/ring-hydroxylating ferredoxin subunit